MKRKTVAVLFGGCSPEYPVSLQSAHAVLTNLDPARYETLAVGITRDGRWFRYDGPTERIPDDSWREDAAHCTPAALSPDRGVHGLLLRDGDRVQTVYVDIAFPVLHGKNGEDGTVQGLIELAGIPLVGCGTLASALCMDKDRAHKLAALAGIAAPRAAVLTRADGPQAWQTLPERLGLPLFIKPVRAGSSFGITRVTAADQLPAALERAFVHDSEVIAEEAIEGFEVGCAILEDASGRLLAGRVDEVELAGGFFDYTEKYTLETAKIHMPARISPEDEARILAAAKTVYRALGCSGFARVDLFFTPAGRIVFNEVNTIPGFTAHSRYPSMMRGAGMSFETVLERLLEAAAG